MNIQDILDKLTKVNPNGKGWTALCPSHDDHRPSLSVSEGDDEQAMLRCHAGCRVEDIVAALGLTISDLCPTFAASADFQAIEFSEPELFCTYCGDPLRDSFAPSPDGRCDTCVNYRRQPRKPRRIRRYSATAHCAVAGFARLPRSRSRRRAYAAA